MNFLRKGVCNYDLKTGRPAKPQKQPVSEMAAEIAKRAARSTEADPAIIGRYSFSNDLDWKKDGIRRVFTERKGRKS